ncbi:hypothetical protein SRABI80_03495 [Peribacillus frigoritolerans]|nr:hypothetical protein SRABI80_03495 [Peribacillus frigoritolerans]
MDRISICNVFISQYIEISKKLKTLSKKLESRLKGPYFFTHFCLLVEECLRDPIFFDSLFKYMDLTENIMERQNNYLERIRAIRNEISNEKDFQKRQEALIEALQFLFVICDEFSHTKTYRGSEEERAEFLRSFLDKEHKRHTGEIRAPLL